MDTLLIATATFGIGYIGINFVSGLVRLWQSTATVTSPAPVAPVVVELVEPVTKPEAPAVAEVIPVSEPETVSEIVIPLHMQQDKEESLDGLGVRELRVRCATKGITWKNANGKNKHLRREQMIAVLQS